MAPTKATSEATALQLLHATATTNATWGRTALQLLQATAAATT